MAASRRWFDSVLAIRKGVMLRQSEDCRKIISELLLPETRVVSKNGFFQDLAWSAEGVTHQFIENAETYHQRYFDRLDFVYLMDRCLELANVDRQLPLKILDIGSGSGSSVFALCKLLPKGDIVACDISPQLLEMLAGFVDSRSELRGRVRACCFDLHRPFFKPDSFDLTVGAAILHHLLDPYAALKNVARSLRPGGKLIVIEPLEAGSLMLAIICDRILNVLASLGESDGPLAAVMRALRLDIQARLGVPVPKPWTSALDDKWVFDEAYLERLSRQLGFSDVKIFPAQQDLTSVFEVSIRSFINDSGNSHIEIPPAVLSAIQEVDEGMSPKVKERFCPTGIVVFSKT